MADTKLIVVPTPIGNLSDITDRVREALLSADLIACEDTRTARGLVIRLGAQAPTISFHMHNEKARCAGMLEAPDQGRPAALVCDAGMPGVSDPGQVVIEAAVGHGVEVVVLPGPSAFVT